MDMKRLWLLLIISIPLMPATAQTSLDKIWETGTRSEIMDALKAGTSIKHRVIIT